MLVIMIMVVLGGGEQGVLGGFNRTFHRTTTLPGTDRVPAALTGWPYLVLGRLPISGVESGRMTT
jgi:hypothetical protein